MIKLIESKKDLIATEESPFGVRIRSMAELYGVGEPFAQFWAQNGSSSLAKLDDTAMLEVGEGDWEELTSFLRMLGVKTLSCSEKAAGRLGFPVSDRGEIMLLHGSVEDVYPSETVKNPGLREIYALLCAAQTESFTPPEFEPFYMDMSYRTRHDAAVSVGIRSDGELAACALCSSLTEHAAVVSAVAVLPQHRHKGLGRSVIATLTSLLNRERVYLFRADGENEEFYHALGFVPDGGWARIEF